MDIIEQAKSKAQESIHFMKREVPQLRTRTGTSASSGISWGVAYIRDRLINDVGHGTLGSRINEGTRASLESNSRIESPEIADLVDSFSILHKLLKPFQAHNKTEIILHVQDAIKALEAVIGKNEPSSQEETTAILWKMEEIFKLPFDNEKKIINIKANFEEMSNLREILYCYLSYLEGAAPCAKEDLKKMRNIISSRLLHGEDDYAKGFLQHILQVQYRQQGNLGFGVISRNLVESIKRAVTKVFFPLVGASSNVATSPFTEFEDPDIPGLEIVTRQNGQTEIVSHAISVKKRPISVMSLLGMTYEYLKNGASPTFLRSYLEALKVSLLHIQAHLNDLKAKALPTDGPFNPQQQEFLASNERIGGSLERALKILPHLQKSGASKDDIETGLHEIEEVLKSHPIGMKYLFHINPFSYLPSLAEVNDHPIDEKDPIDVLQDMIHALEGGAQRHQAIATMDESYAFNASIETARKTSIRFTIYQTISWWVGTPPSGFSIPTFDSMMLKLYNPDGTPSVVSDQEAQIFRESMIDMIEKCSHLFFITRWITELALPIIETLADFAISRVFKEADNRIMLYINESYNESTGDARTSIPDALAAVSHAIVNAYKLYSEGQNSSCFDKNGILTHHFFNDVRKLFLRGHDGKASIYKYLEVALLELLREFTWTSSIREINDSLLKWASDTNYGIIEAICWVIIAPLRAILWTLSTALVWPIQTTLNYTIKTLASWLISKIKLPELLTNKAINSVIGDTDFTPVLDDILLDLLKMLWDLMQEPSDPNSRFGEIKTSQKTVNSIANMLSSLLRALQAGKAFDNNQLPQFFEKGQGGDFTAILQGLSDTLQGVSITGVSRLLSKSIVVLTRKQRKICTLALTTMHKAMITSGRETAPRALSGERVTVQNRSRDLINHYVSLLGWEAVKMATNKLSDPFGEEEYRINAHARTIQDLFGFQPNPDFSNPSKKTPLTKKMLREASETEKSLGFNYQSKLIEWTKLIENLFEGKPENPIVQNARSLLDAMHTEMLDISYSLREELTKMASDNSISKASLEIHKKRVLAISESLSEFQKGFQVIHEFYLNKSHPALSGIHGLLFNIHQQATRVKNSLDAIEVKQMGLQNGEKELKELRSQLAALKNLHTELIRSVPPQGPISKVTELLYVSINALERSICFSSEKQNYYINFIQKRIQPTKILASALPADFTSRVLEYANPRDNKGLTQFLEIHLNEIKFFLPQWNTPGTQDHNNYLFLTKILSLPKDLCSLIDLNLRRRLTCERCNEFKNMIEGIGTLLKNEVNNECVRAKKTFSTLSSVAQAQIQVTDQIQNSPVANESDAVKNAIGAFPSDEILNGAGMFGAIVQLEKAITSLTSVEKISFEISQNTPIVPFIQRKVFDFIKSTVDSLFETVIRDKSVLEGFVMRLYVRFLENQGINLLHKAITTDRH
jgi:hypothetical protein